MIIEISLDYMSDSVLCFDPEKVLWKLAEHFPQVLTDEKDHAEAEVQSVSAFLADRGEEISEGIRSHILASIKRKARQNGPAYAFSFDSAEGTTVKGWARRYGTGFKSEGDMPEALKANITDFLKGLGISEISVIKVQFDSVGRLISINQ